MVKFKSGYYETDIYFISNENPNIKDYFKIDNDPIRNEIYIDEMIGSFEIEGIKIK